VPLQPRRGLDEAASELGAEAYAEALAEHRRVIRIDGRRELSLVVLGDAALLGTSALDALRLAADPVGRRLVPVPALLMRPAA